MNGTGHDGKVHAGELGFATLAYAVSWAVCGICLPSLPFPALAALSLALAASITAFWIVHARGKARLAARAAEAAQLADASPAAEPARDAAEGETGGEGADGASPEPELPDFSVSAVIAQISNSLTPVEDLADIVRRILGGASSGGHDEPCEAERFLAKSLEEAGILEDDLPLPPCLVIPDGRTGLPCLMPTASKATYLAMQRLLAIEGALRRMQCAEFAWERLDGASAGELQAFTQGLFGSVVGQLSSLSVGDVSLEEERPDGEWAVRRGIALLIESLQTPTRLVADYRVNMATGSVALQIEAPSPYVMPRSAWSPELGRSIDTTADMRRQAASAYALRLGILLARATAWCSPEVREVYVAGVRNTATRHLCLYSARFERAQLEGIDPQHLDDPFAIYVEAGAIMDVDDGILKPVRQGFSLEEERFCPASRYDVVELSGRELERDVSHALGARSVSDLGIDGEAMRSRLADDVMRSMSPEAAGSTETCARIILDAAARTNDLALLGDARRTVEKLIEGTLDDADPIAIGEEIARGDELSRAVDAAARALLSRRGVDSAVEGLERALLPLDGSGAFDDGPHEQWRTFGSYVERTLYNRRHAGEGARIRLVPKGYYNAHLMLASTLMLQDRPAEALGHALRALELSPLDMGSHLRVVRCHEMMGELDEAVAYLRDLLETAHAGEAIGVAYYRMAYMQWQLGHQGLAAACYLKSMQFPSSVYPLALMEMGKLMPELPEEGLEMDAERIDAMLADAGIPIAPTQLVEEVLVEGAKAALDANIFPAARDFAATLGELTGDSLVRNIFHSMEREPDR